MRVFLVPIFGLLAGAVAVDAGVTEAIAAGRGGVGPGIGFGQPGQARVGPARVGTFRVGVGRSSYGRYGGYGFGRNGRYAGAGYGAGYGGSFDVPGHSVAATGAGPDGPARLDVWSYSKSVVIHRGPSFGEPGYVSEPVVLRLHPSGFGRFQVEKIRP